MTTVLLPLRYLAAFVSVTLSVCWDVVCCRHYHMMFKSMMAEIYMMQKGKATVLADKMLQHNLHNAAVNLR